MWQTDPTSQGQEGLVSLDDAILLMEKERLQNGNHKRWVGYRGISAHFHLQQDSI